MPPPLSSNIPGNRRASASGRQRENRVLSLQMQSNAGPNRRHKSRSPDTHVEDRVTRSDDATRRKRRPANIVGSNPSTSSSIVTVARPPLHEDPGDRGRAKPKIRPRPHAIWVDDEEPYIVTNLAPQVDRAPAAQLTRSKRRERSRSLETSLRHSRKTSTPDLVEGDGEPMYTGPLVQADYHRMKQEVENLRKQVAMSKKTIHKQSKVIDELRRELTTVNESHRTQSAEMEKLKLQSRKTQDLLTTVESNLTCQICMEIMLKPFGLSPCGHVLCMSCLLVWFRSAPPGDDEMLDEESPDALLYRKKTCPCCRTVIRSKPIPLYLVKSLACALDKAKAPEGALCLSPPPDEADPWVGIFRDPDEYEAYWSTDEDEDEDDEEDDENAEDDEGYDDDDDDYWSFDGYGTDEDEERYDGPYYPFLHADSEDLKMLRRGATLQMIELFAMGYSHDTGLTAVVDDENMIYLGWNIELHPDDETGEEYIDWILGDMYDRPERWRVVHDGLDGTWTAHRLVPQYEVEGEYDNTDSEMWTAEEDSEDDM
ncbi:hypothetical protein BD414DRAFT_522794 [Trametes punicea]|nr:hypothetical protein BD414DRAFT_522794 [Trametes punicea]